MAIIGCLLIFGVGLLSAQGKALDLGARLDDMVAKNYYYPEIQVALGCFTYEYTDLPTPFNRWLEDTLGSVIYSTKKIKLFTRRAPVAMDPAFRDSFEDFFRSNNVGGIISGKYFDEGDKVKIKLEVVDLSTGNLLGQQELFTPKSSLPEGLSIKPQKEAEVIKNKIADVSPAKDQGMTVSVATEKGKGASYEEGEYIHMFVTVDRDAYIKVYSINSNGNISLIWPNQLGGSGRVLAGQALTIPTAQDPFEFPIVPPFGTEFVKVLASSEPFAVTEESFTDLGTDWERVKKAGASKKKALTAEALASFFTYAKR